MASEGHRGHLLDSLARRAAGQPRSHPSVESEPAHEGGETFDRGQVLKRFGAAAALSLLPLSLLESSAEAKRNCFEPCLGLVKAAADRNLGRCRPHVADFFLGSSLGVSVWCAIENTAGLQNDRLECHKPECGSLGAVIKRGGRIGSIPVVELDLPAGTQAECENCESVGGYCGACPQGSPGFEQGKSTFFCGTPPVLPCRYCGGC